MVTKKQEHFGLPIKTVYYRGKETVRTTRAGSAFRAVPHCIEHMQVNHYEASVAEVYDLRDGTLHAVVKRNVQGNLTIVFQREVKEGV